MSFLYRNHLIGSLLLFLLLAAACKQKDTGPDLSSAILSVKQTGELVTAEYTLSKIIRASDNQTWYKIGDRKILMSCEAHMKAGINLQNIKRDNFTATGDSIAVVLPHAQFFSLDIPADRIRVVYEEKGLFRDDFSAAEREQLLVQAERQIRTLANSLGILGTAENNAAVYMQNLLQQAGYKHVSVSFS